MNVRLLEMPRFIADHRWTRARMSEYVDRELKQGERRRVDEHVRRCPQCSQLLAGLERTVAALGLLGKASAADVSAGVIERLRAQR